MMYNGDKADSDGFSLPDPLMGDGALGSDAALEDSFLDERWLLRGENEWQQGEHDFFGDVSLPKVPELQPLEIEPLQPAAGSDAQPAAAAWSTQHSIENINKLPYYRDKKARATNKTYSPQLICRICGKHTTQYCVQCSMIDTDGGGGARRPKLFAVHSNHNGRTCFAKHTLAPDNGHTISNIKAVPYYAAMKLASGNRTYTPQLICHVCKRHTTQYCVQCSAKAIEAVPSGDTRPKLCAVHANINGRSCYEAHVIAASNNNMSLCHSDVDVSTV